MHLHERFGGVVPEIASRAHVERILPVIDEALRKAGLKLDRLDAVAVANTPGLAGSLLVGLTAAKTLCVATGLPLLAVNHLQAHIYACRMASGRDVFPCVGLIVSGGHSNLYRCESPTDFTPLGGTIDDAAGEAFDKVASLLGLPYPGGPAIQRAAEAGNKKAVRFPRPLLDDPARLDFSFSGLKTAVRYLVVGPGKLSGKPHRLTSQEIADITASFQEAVIDCLVGKAELALQSSRLPNALCGRRCRGEQAVPRAARTIGRRTRLRIARSAVLPLHRQRGDGSNRGRTAASGQVRRSVARHPAGART